MATAPRHTKHHWHRSSESTRRIAWLYGAVFIICLLTLWRGGDALKAQQIEELEQDTREQLRQLSSVVESAIAKYQHMPTLLASNDRVRKALRDGLPSDINQLNRELEQINRITEASDSYIIDLQGNTIAASNYRLETSFVGGNFAFRPYFKEAVQGKAGRYYALGTTSNRRGYYFSYPVYEGDSIIGVAVVKVDLTQFEKRFSNQAYDFLMLDPDGVVFSSSRPEWLYRVMGELTHEQLARIADSQRYFDQSIETLPIVSKRAFSEHSDIIAILEEAVLPGQKIVERRRYLSMRRPTQLLDFQVAVLVPLTAIEEQIALWRAIFAGGITITILILGLAQLRSRMLKERSDAIEMARHNQAYIREVIQHTQAGLVTLDGYYRIEALNPAVEKLLATPLSTLIGQPLSDLFVVNHADQARWYAALDSSMEYADTRLTTVEGQLHVMGQTNVVAVEATICELRLPNRRSHLVTFHDMTDRKRYEQELTDARNALELRVKERTYEFEEANQRLRHEIAEHKATQQELIQTAKLAVLGQLSAGLNHELNQPLTAIRAFADNGLKFLEREKHEQARANLQQISQLGHHMGDIIARFKVFARKGTVAHTPIDIQAAINGAYRIMTPRLKEANIDVQIPLNGQWAALADMVFLEQVLVNLIANAVDAIVEHEAIERRIEVAVDVHANRVTIYVRDTGSGLSDDAIAHLFEPFYTSKSSGAGLGLGLSISQRIMESMNGSIAARNRAQGGAEFYVTLNAFEPEQE